ncbi:MFS general substrate transporter [Nadsonia fulvescens var. elongata DSM 6958]|uniref:MFS general substrate transporter n=1 Tax=Nadsonia fulvescens var. elongata DSM 6958 TaxID=857566 RepID=A0A1E3PE96_9ASCO|nr:MFS general substrate transporter [Nadsonia fulvescens var. elongata DSM 6958]
MSKQPPNSAVVDTGGISPPNFSISSINHYLKTRFTTLLPKKNCFAEKKHLINPFVPLSLINKKQWNFILVALAGWTWDAFDFFCVSLNATDIARDLHVSVKDITWGITLVLMLRSVGAVIFGYFGDKYGRKWPYIANLGLLVVLQIGSGFIKTYKEFLGIRALFGIAMGGVYGNVAATALDDCPPDARSIVSGILQQGYALGYLLCVIFTRAIANTSSYEWRALFWFSAGPAFLLMIWRFFMPETDAYIAQKTQERSGDKTQAFWFKAKSALKTYWLVLIYLVILMAGMNFMSHGSQDLYPTLLTNQLHFGRDRSTVTNCVANLGAIAGGIIIGHASSFLGRRFTLILCCFGGGALIYPWAFVTSSGINAGVFFLQFFVQGAWGVIPIHLSELSPPDFRSIIVGLAYQLGNLCSSASSTIETTIGEQFPLYNDAGVALEGKYNYALVMSIFMGCVFGFCLICFFLGPENKDAKFGTDPDAGEIEGFFENDEKAHEEFIELADAEDRIANKV